VDSKNLCRAIGEFVIRRGRTTGGGDGNDIALYVQHNGEANEPFLCGGKLLALVDLFPECEVVICTAVHARLERDSSCPVEHEVGYLRCEGGRLFKVSLEPASVRRSTHYKVSEVDECPAKLLGHTGEGIERELDDEDETRVH
jgi:hypothetical protein